MARQPSCGDCWRKLEGLTGRVKLSIPEGAPFAWSGRKPWRRVPTRRLAKACRSAFPPRKADSRLVQAMVLALCSEK